MKCVFQWGIPHFHQCEMENTWLAWEKLKAGCVVPQTTADLVASSVLSSLQFKYTLQELGSPEPWAVKSFPSGTISSTCSNSPSSSAGAVRVATSRAVEGWVTSLLPTPGSWQSSGLLLEHTGLSALTLVLLGSCRLSWAPLSVWAGAGCLAVPDLSEVQAKSLLLAASCRDTCKARQSWPHVPHPGTRGCNRDSGKQITPLARELTLRHVLVTNSSCCCKMNYIHVALWNKVQTGV